MSNIRERSTLLVAVWRWAIDLHTAGYELPYYWSISEHSLGVLCCVWTVDKLSLVVSLYEWIVWTLFMQKVVLAFVQLVEAKTAENLAFFFFLLLCVLIVLVMNAPERFIFALASLWNVYSEEAFKLTMCCKNLYLSSEAWMK